ncbi:hypothetical protein GOTRE_150_00690 [Gordonia terrae NBRC 100016]|uniref:Uncharacterized protein n=1 Tax=Gordonia terrae NBRC 100016 TaxID=1089454 RepID=A0ABQ0HKC4_9ACTN|nr:hypothetical protein GOTRE_150_00690 [Gordonia terrae NBRC 100016]
MNVPLLGDVSVRERFYAVTRPLCPVVPGQRAPVTGVDRRPERVVWDEILDESGHFPVGGRMANRRPVMGADNR